MEYKSSKILKLIDTKKKNNPVFYLNQESY